MERMDKRAGGSVDQESLVEVEVKRIKFEPWA